MSRHDTTNINQRDPITMHQEIVRYPEPSAAVGHGLVVNPPTFRWPIDKKSTAYILQYGRDATFAGAATITITGVKETFFRPPEPLPAGRYFWRYKGDSDDDWSPPAAFTIEPHLKCWSLPPWPAIMEKIPTGRPRLWLRPEKLPAVKRRMQEGLRQKVLEEWRADLQKLVGVPLPLSANKVKRPTANYYERIMQRWEAMADVKTTMIPAGEMAIVAMLTGDEALAGEAVRRAMTAAAQDPDGFTSISVSDFANGEIVKNTAIIYDLLHDRLTAPERRALEDNIRYRLGQIYKRYRPQLEQQLCQAHAWQHIMTDFMIGSLALYKVVPEAAAWLEWGLKMFVAFYPWWGGVDGGAAENAYYLEDMALIYSQLNAMMIEEACGIDILQNPWFEANPYYLIYAHPPGSWRSQFGDYREQVRPGRELLVPMLRYAGRFHNPYAAAYAAALGRSPAAGRNGDEGVMPAQGDAEAESMWPAADGASRLLYLLGDIEINLDHRPLPKSSPAELPKAKAFYDCGQVFMHSRLGDPQNNIMFEFKSSPYGSFGHNHADQNCFNLIAFDEVLALDTGYYIGYGDTHHYGWTMTTAAHNGVLIDGEGQPIRRMDAYGRIADFYTGARFHYAVGAAEKAYRNSPVTRFLRHVLWLEPATYLIYDQIDTSRPTTVQWLLHALDKMEVDAAGRRVEVRRPGARMQVCFAYPAAGDFSQTDQFAVPVPETPVKGTPADYPNQWHLTAFSPEKTTAHRWLTALFVEKASGGAGDDAGITGKWPVVAKLSGAGWLGLQWQRAAGADGMGETGTGGLSRSTSWAAFSTGEAPVQIKLGGVTALARALAVLSAPDGAGENSCLHIFAVEALNLSYNGRELLSNDEPKTIELTISLATGEKTEKEHDGR